jgi:hypothetical protein
MEQAGRKASISIVGNAVELFDEACTDISALQNGTKWQVSDINKRLITDISSSLYSYGYINPFQAETGTNSTTIKKANHKLQTGDIVSNASRGNAERAITKVDNNTFTVAAISGQTVGDVITPLSIDLPSSIVIDAIKGIVVTDRSFSGVNLNGAYLPKTLVATANDYSYNQASDMGDVTPFLATHKKRIPLEKYSSGTLSYWDITDTYFTDALLADTPKYLVLEDGASQKALLAYFDKTELKASIGSPQSMTIGFINANEEVG